MKRRKLKLLFDMEQLAVSDGRGTGIARVAAALLHGLKDCAEIELFPLVTSTRGDAAAYLEHAGFQDLAKKLFICLFYAKPANGIIGIKLWFQNF